MDTVPALQSLAKRFRLGIISNVDDDLFAETKKKLPVAVRFRRDGATGPELQAIAPEL